MDFRNAIKTFVSGNFSPAPLYVFTGIWYFATHRYLYPLAKTRLVPLAVISTCILVILFLTIYLPVVAFLAIFHFSGSAWVNGTFIILEIGSLLIALLFEALLVDGTQVDIFDSVLIAEGCEDLVRNRRAVSEDIEESDPPKRLGPRERGATFAPFSLRQIVEFVILLPLNFIPIAGVPMFLLLTGYRAGPLLNRRYFVLKGFTRKQRNDFVRTKRRRWEYTWIGTAHVTLQLIPLVSMLFLLTTAAGCALWSARIERQNADQRGLVAEEQEEEDHLPPAYSDEP